LLATPPARENIRISCRAVPWSCGSVVRPLRALFVYDLDLLVEHLPGEPVNRQMEAGQSWPHSTGSDERFDFAKRCGSGKRSAFGFVQSNPFVNRFTQLCVDGLFVAAMYSAKHKAGAATNVALVFFAPRNNFHIAIRCLAHD